MQLKNAISREQKKKNCLFTNIYEYIIFINIDYFRYRLYDYWTNKLIILVTNIIIIYRILTKDAFKKIFAYCLYKYSKKYIRYL